MRAFATLLTDLAIASVLVAAGVAFLVLAPGCTFARVRYLDGAEAEKELACTVDVNTFICRGYYRALREDGVQLVPARQPRGERKL